MDKLLKPPDWDVWDEWLPNPGKSDNPDKDEITEVKDFLLKMDKMDFARLMHDVLINRT